MRILLYIEPFPIRNSLTHFQGVSRKLLPLLAAGSAYDVRMFGNKATLDMLGEPALSTHGERLISATEEEEQMFKAHMLPWQQAGMSTWLDLMAGTGEVTEDYLRVLRRVWNIFPFEIIVNWGENGAIRHFVKERPVTRIGMELGCTRPPFMESLAIDPFGTNGSGVVPKLTVAELSEIVGNRPMSRHEALMAYSHNVESLGYEEQFLPLPADISSRLTSEEKIVFLPLQLFDDANLLRFSPYRTVEEAVLDVVPKLADKGYTILVKPHPASEQRHSAATANAVARAALRRWWKYVVWCDHPKPIPNARLISLADFVVTVNSSVGFEALYFDKPVVVLGDAVYKPLDLFPSLDDMLEDRFDRASFLHGAGLLRRFMLDAYLQHDSLTSDATAFLQRVCAIDEICTTAPGDPVAFARSIWHAAAASKTIARSVLRHGRSTAGKAEFAQALDSINAADSGNAGGFGAYELAARRLWLHAGKPSLDFLLAWLDSAWAVAERRAEIIRAGKLVDPEYYLNMYPDIREMNIDPIQHFSHYGMLENRLPRPGADPCPPDAMLDLLKRAAKEMMAQPALQDYPLTEEEEAYRQTQLQQIGDALRQRSHRIAVVAHLYYRDLVPELLEKLAHITEPFDLIVTLPDWGVRAIIASVRAVYPEALFYQAVNRGRDIAPFLDVLPLIVDKDYDAVLKIQTKRGYYQQGRLLAKLGDLWRDEALAALLGSAQRVDIILDAFRTDPTLAMVGPSPYLQPLAGYPYHDGGQLASTLLAPPMDEGFFAGTMFWLRPRFLNPLGSLTMTHFAPETGANDGALAHLVERMFGHAATSGGGRIAGAPIDPGAPLNHTIQPSTVPIHDYLTARLEERRRQFAQAAAGQLIW
ncbi:rhamnan synthesis F family protein [Massilia sp. METH4]|uniref:rhamnan synthesis F family protein n=1 Tax=Massilia sp. METH4 TaxID=3123041 RepID=UPI0030CEBEBC